MAEAMATNMFTHTHVQIKRKKTVKVTNILKKHKTKTHNSHLSLNLMIVIT